MEKKSLAWVIVKFEMRKNRKIDAVRESGKLRWKKKEEVWVREK